MIRGPFPACMWGISLPRTGRTPASVHVRKATVPFRGGHELHLKGLFVAVTMHEGSDIAQLQVVPGNILGKNNGLRIITASSDFSSIKGSTRKIRGAVPRGACPKPGACA